MLCHKSFSFKVFKDTVAKIVPHKMQLVQNPFPQNSILNIQYFLNGCDCVANE